MYSVWVDGTELVGLEEGLGGSGSVRWWCCLGGGWCAGIGVWNVVMSIGGRRLYTVYCISRITTVYCIAVIYITHLLSNLHSIIAQSTIQQPRRAAPQRKIIRN